jgi:phytoene synthase
LTATLQRLGADLRHGHLYLPQDELARFGVALEDLGQRRATPGFAALMAHYAERVRGFYARALSALPRAERRAQRPGRVMAAIGSALLDEIERDGFRVLDRRVSLTPLAKAWIAWKTSWRW